jgi:hypothetical protein
VSQHQAHQAISCSTLTLLVGTIKQFCLTLATYSLPTAQAHHAPALHKIILLKKNLLLRLTAQPVSVGHER